MKVAQSEARLLSLLRALFEERDAEPFLVTAFPLDDTLSPNAVQLVEHTLAVGCVRQLARAGGWRSEKRPVDGRLVEGRLWDRHPAPELHFSAWSHQLLHKLLTEALGHAEPTLRAPKSPGLGDRVLAFVVARALHAHGLHADLRRLVGHEPLVQLGFALHLDVDGLMTAPWLIEANQVDLETLWLDHLRRTAELREPLAFAERNLAFDRTLHAFLDAIEPLERRDLADFLVGAGQRWISEDPDWMPPIELDPETPLRARTEARRAMAAFPGVLLRLAQGIHADAQVNFFDEPYAAAQVRLERWERFGPARVTAARNAIERL